MRMGRCGPKKQLGETDTINKRAWNLLWESAPFLGSVARYRLAASSDVFLRGR